MAYAFTVIGTGAVVCSQTGADTSYAGIITAANAVPTVARSTNITVNTIRKAPAGAAGLMFRCTTAGTTAAVAPSYEVVAGSTVTDGTAVFTAFLAPFALVVGEVSDYYMTDIELRVNGTLTIANPALTTLTCSRFVISGTGNYTSGAWAADGVTPLYSGVHFTAVGGTMRTPDSANGGGAFEVWGGGQYTLIGGTYRVSAGIYYQNNAVVREYGVKVVCTRTYSATQSARIRAYSANVVKRGCEHYDIAYDMFRIPAEFSVAAFGAEYVSQYVGSSANGVDGTFIASALRNVDGALDFDNFGSGWVELFDCRAGADLNVVCRGPAPARHVVPLRQTIDFSVTDLNGAPISGAGYRCVDAPDNSPPTPITTAADLKTWDFTAPLTYTGVTAADGSVRATPVLHVWWGAGSNKNLRFPNATATFRFVGYAYRQQDVLVKLGSDAPIARPVALPSANNITMSEAEASALQGITLVASGAASGTVTITGGVTAQQAWHYWRNWKGQIANAASDDSWEFDGQLLNMGAWNLVVTEGATFAATFTTSGEVSNAGIIDGTFTTSAGPSTMIEVVATAGSSIYVGNAATGEEKLFLADATAGVYRAYFAPGEVVNCQIVRERYGKLRAEQAATTSGGIIRFDPVEVPDIRITNTSLESVLAYTSIENEDKFYDRTAALRLTQAGIKLGPITLSDGNSLLVQAPYSVLISKDATEPYVLAGDLITLKATGYATGQTFARTILSSSDTLTAASNEIISATVEDANGDSTLTLVGGDGVFELWKVPVATATADYATGVRLTNPTVANSSIRFVSAPGFDIVGLDINSNVRRRTSMARGTYTQSFYVGDQIQVAEAPQIRAINTKVDVMTLEVEVLRANQNVINAGVKKASLLIPHKRETL